MLIGRDHERERLRIVLAHAMQGDPGALIIRGDPGMGKTRLLHAAAAEYSGDLRIIRVDGHEAETDIPYAALSMLLGPLIHGLSGLPDTQATALKAALNLGPAVHGDRLGVAAATLTLLANSADDQPMVIAVDDAHLLDLPSLEALVFSIRRMRAERIAVILTARCAVDVSPAAQRWLAALPEMPLNGLDFAAAKRLLADRGALSSAMWEATGGNPLALLDLPTATSRLPVEPVHLNRRLVRAYERRMASLSGNTRRAILLLAVAGSADDAVDGALAQQGLGRGDLEAAEDAGLLVQGTSGIRFRHPLVRSAVYHAAAPGRKRMAHQALAAVYEQRGAAGAAERRAFHLAAATASPDEDVAGQLAAAAKQAAARQSHVTAHALFERAARLSPAGPARTQRLVDAALTSWAAGMVGTAGPLLEFALAETDDQHSITAVQHLQCRIQMWCGQPVEARDELLALADRTEIVEPAWSAVMRSQAALWSAFLGDQRLAVHMAQRSAHLVRDLPAAARLPVVLIQAFTLAIDGDSAAARDLLAWCEEHLAAYDPLSGDQLLVVAANSYASVEEHAPARRWLESAVRMTRSANAVGLLPFQLSWLASACWRDGDWAAGLAHAHAAVNLAEETGWLTELPNALIVLATFEATLGDADGCREHLARAVELTAPTGARIFEARAARALGLLELGEGRPGPAAEHLTVIAEFAYARRLGNPVLLSWAGDLVEAHVRAGEPHRAHRAFDVLVHEAETTGRPTERAVAARCRGMLDDEQGDDAFTEALRWHERARQPFEQARSQLCFGEFLRRCRRLTEARQVLADAFGTFTRLGARLWAQRTEAELRATGIASRPRRERSTTRLTPQELQVAMVVAGGATNVESAAQLFLSPKTIEFHLSNIYRKLGIRSRAQLVRAVVAGTSGNSSGPFGGIDVRDDEPLIAR